MGMWTPSLACRDSCPRVGFALRLETLPFLLRERLSYSKIAIFTLSSYPYSLKLLWSPFVDAWFFPSVGRRRSWIIPMQTILGCIMLWMSFRVQGFLDGVRRLSICVARRV